MTELKLSDSKSDYEDVPSLIGVASLLIRSRKLIVSLALLFGSIGLASGLTSQRLYKSWALFIPEGNDAPTSELALAASQFGINVPTSTNSWGPPLYVELLHSRDLLAPMVQDTISVVERKLGPIPILQMLEASGKTPAARVDDAITTLNDYVGASEEKKFGAVRISVTTPWPSVSFALATRLIKAVEDFNVRTRKTRAAAERQFVETQSVESERSLRDAESRLQFFMQGNKALGSPQLSFERDRLQREVTLRQGLYTSWMQNREQARIRQIRDTPVLTVLESPVFPVNGESRGTVRKTILGVIAGCIIAVLLRVIGEKIAGIRNLDNMDSDEFVRLVNRLTIRFRRTSGHSA